MSNNLIPLEVCMKIIASFLLLLFIVSLSFADGDPAFEDTWELVPDMSSHVNRYARNMELDITLGDNDITIIRRWRRGRADTLQVTTDGVVNDIPVRQSRTSTTVYSGIHMDTGDVRTVTATWQNDRRLVIHQTYDVEISQGTATLKEVHTLNLNKNHEFLTYRISRESRTDNPTSEFVFKVKGSLQAYMMKLKDNWIVKDSLDRQAMMIGLEGLVNRDGPHFYLIYPETWQFTYSGRLYEWYQEDRGYSFTELETPAEALKTFRDKIKGYVVWDKEVRTSLIVAYTIAGIEDAVVASEDQIAMLDSLGFSMVEDLRGSFAGQTDAEIYSWAKDRYWDQCSRKYIIWLGGHAAPLMKPGVADWGVAQKVFFQDLSTDPEDTTEYNIAKELLGDMDSDALVMGWHSYAKDGESQHVTLTSSFGLPVEGLHSVPNVSFEHQVGFSEGFEFKNNHNIEPGKEYIPEDKVYLACIQTDGIGIGSWLKPGRGEIPYAWETLMNYSWLVPSLLEFFYSTSTPNDYFIGALSGPGYMYPKAVPEDKLPGLIRRADTLMQQLDLRVFDIMDYSRHVPREEFADLTKPVIEAYYENMPDAIGFVNGYAPANTFYHQDGRPLISFEYYLAPTVPEDEAAADLIELAELNDKRPYFLLLHIRETSDVARVKSILNQLPDSFELVPLDIFLKMAGNNPTFTTRYIEK